RREVNGDDIDLEVATDDVPPRPTPPAKKGERREDQIARILTEVDVYIKYGLKTKALEHVERIFELEPSHREAAVRKKQLVLELRGPAAAAEVLLHTARDVESDELDALLHPPAESAARDESEEEVVVEVGMDEMLSEEAGGTASLSYEPSPAAAEIDLDEGLELEPPAKAAAPAGAKKAAAGFDAELDALLKSAVPSKRAAVPAPSATSSPARPAPAKPAAPSAEPPAPPTHEDRLAEEIEEVEFFLQQGLENEARDALQNLLARHPEDAGVLALQAKMDAAAAPPALSESPAEATPAEDAEPEPEMESIDIAEEIEREAVDAGDDVQVPFDDVFEQFKRGVAQQVDESDYETHYNLGIAYKEMGLLDDAVREFTLAQKASERSVDAITMIGLCQLAKGNAGDALDYFLKGLNSRGVTPQGAMALRYEIGQAYESMSRFREATKFYEKVHAMDTSFRDVSTRLDHVKKRSGEQKGEASHELDELLTDTPAEDAREDKAGGDKASKISYV
ncbi:MAG: hypothetical protein HYZ27_00315, partial [Deltaproteobacteria bacterium]|nr:hypothetical protein [Deltaproteobacteria bacterium]